MSLLRVPVEGVTAGRLRLDASAAHYVTRVHRLGPGDRFVAFDPALRLEADVTVVEVRRARVECEVGDPRPAASIARRSFWLLMGLTKHDAFEWTLREATALGVTDIVPVVCARTTVPAPDAGSRRADRWQRVVVDGARQCGRGDAPRIHGAATLTEVLDRFRGSDALRLCLWERADRPVRDVVGGGIDASSVAVLIGPEGGLEDDEARSAEAAGFACVLLGDHVLRAETAAVAALGLVRGMW